MDLPSVIDEFLDIFWVFDRDLQVLDNVDVVLGELDAERVDQSLETHVVGQHVVIGFDTSGPETFSPVHPLRRPDGRMARTTRPWNERKGKE